MGKHKHRSRSPEERNYKERKYYKREKSHSRSPERRHKYKERDDHHAKSSKWEDSPDHHRDYKRKHYDESNSGGRRDRYRDDSDKYDRERESNRERKLHHRRRRNDDDDSRSYEWGKRSDDKGSGKDDRDDRKDKEKPNFGLSGKLAEDTNKVNGVVIKYAEPPEARIPKKRWRLYPFKGEKSLPTLYIHRQSCYLIGRDRKIVDIPVDHPSCSKQHAALQYRLMPYEKESGVSGKRVTPYLMDLESANGTFLNNKQVDPRRYYQLMEKDVVKFGFSTREYVLLHDSCKDDENDDNSTEPTEVKEEPN